MVGIIYPSSVEIGLMYLPKFGESDPPLGSDGSDLGSKLQDREPTLLQVYVQSVMFLKKRFQKINIINYIHNFESFR